MLSGIAIIPLYNLKPGNYTLNIKYTGDNKYLPDNETVTVELFKETPEMTVSAKNNIINVVLPKDATGNVTATVNGKEYTTPIKNGKVTITVTGLEPGKYTANIKYTGNDYYYPRNEKTSITIPKINPKMDAYFEDNYADSSDEELEFEIRTKTFSFKPMSVEEAILQMNLLEHQFYVFTNQDTEQVNVVYKRKNGGYGLIVPA